MLSTTRVSARAALIALIVATLSNTAAARPSSWNQSPDPDAPAGHCRNQSSALGPKWVLVNNVGGSVVDVLAVQVLSCQPWSGGGLGVVDCEAAGAAGVPYAYCVQAKNDGLGNDLTIGVLKRDALSDANGQYSGCPAGATLRPKLELVRSSHGDPRRLKGAVTLSCGVASGSPAAAAEVACPAEPHPYARCIGTPNDGHGNAVTIGLLAANGPGDPYGLYGECDSSPPVRAGFLYKADAVAQAGRSLAGVRSIDVAYCAMGSGGAFHALPCEDIPTFPPILAARFDYCVTGADVNGNNVTLGVSGK